MLGTARLILLTNDGSLRHSLITLHTSQTWDAAEEYSSYDVT